MSDAPYETDMWIEALACHQRGAIIARQFVGLSLRRRREELGLSLRRVAKLAKCDPSLYSRLERGKAWAMPMIRRADQVLRAEESSASSLPSDTGKPT